VNIHTTDALTLYGHIVTVEQQTIVQKYGDWYTGRWWVGCYNWYSEEGTGWAGVLPSPLLTSPSTFPFRQRPVCQLRIIWCGTI